MICQETYEKAFEIMKDIKSDPRLEKLNAIVFLSLKTKGRSKGRFQLSQEQFSNLTNYALENNVSFGMDSCSAQKFTKAIEGHANEAQMNQSAEPCESSLYSSYIDVKGDFYPCSFSPGTPGWETGISVLDCDDFIKDVWFSDRVRKFSEGVIKCRNCKQSCSIYDI